MRTVGTAILDGSTTVPRPGDKSLKEGVAVLENWAASLKGLEDDPNKGEDKGAWPCNGNKKDQPAQSVDRIGAHVSRFTLRCRCY